MRRNHAPIALCISAMLLAACTSSGTRPISAPAALSPPTPPPPAPPPNSFNPCPAPVGSDCIVTMAKSQLEYLRGTSSDHALILRGNGQLRMADNEYRFDGGTLIEEGALAVGFGQNADNHDATLQSDVLVRAAGRLQTVGKVHGNVENHGSAAVYWGGTIRGDADNHGSFELYGTVVGDVDNHGTLTLTGAVEGNLVNRGRLNVGDFWVETRNLVDGNFRQSVGGTLSIMLPTDDPNWAYTSSLQINGRADIEGGTLELYRPSYNDFGAWYGYITVPLPTAPTSFRVLHADDGVHGEFARWIARDWFDETGKSNPLFITGSLRYEPNDIWFDLGRISLTAAMATQATNTLTLVSAGNIDTALAAADGFAGLPPTSLALPQRQFLTSAASLLWMRDRAQAGLALESLAGHAHVSVRDGLQAQLADSSAQLDARLSELAYTTRPLAWSGSLANVPGSQRYEGIGGGGDQWLTPRLLVGAGIGSGRSTLRFEGMGGQASSESPIASVHAHYRGDGWHATGQAGAGRATVRMQRPIKTGAPGLHAAHSQHVLDHTFAHGEIGRDMAVAGGRLVPFAAFDYMGLRSDGFAEQGDTGFELVGAPEHSARLSGSVGARYARQWDIGRSTLRLDLGASYRHSLLEAGDPLRAAFRGVPDVRFDVPGQRMDGVTELRLRLDGTLGRRWDWSLAGARGFGEPRGDEVWLGLGRAF